MALSFAKIAAEQKEEGPLAEVQVDGLVLLKIAKHCRESAPNIVSGQLLGLDVESTLEVTSSFAFPTTTSVGRSNAVDSTSSAAAALMATDGGDLEEIANEGAQYQLEVLRCLREINVDSNTVGWYQSSYLDSYQTRELVETFISYQESIKRCVCIIYDPLCSSKGNVGFKAIRLSENFVELYKDGILTVEGLDSSNLSWNEIFDEIPITVHNGVLMEALMEDLEQSNPRPVTQDDYDRLDLSTDAFLSKNFDYLFESLDDYQREQNNLAQHQRNIMKNESQRAAWISKRRAENAQRRAQGEELLPEQDPSNPLFRNIAEPDRLELLLINRQLGNYCDQMERFSERAMQKMKLLTAMRD